MNTSELPLENTLPVRDKKPYEKPKITIEMPMETRTGSGTPS